MRKGVIRNMCNGDASTSTLDQLLSATRKEDHSKTLEEMILDLELEEDRAKPPPLYAGRRMSCVNNADILRSARNALNQYPRFSLDGKDAMYRSSFRTHHGGEPLLHGLVRDRIINININNGTTTANQRHRHRHRHPHPHDDDDDDDDGRSGGGEGVVVWCKPGVVAKLMGLDAMPYVPSLPSTRRTGTTTTTGDRRRRQINNNRSYFKPTSKAATPIGPQAHDDGGWPTRRFRF